MDLLYRLNAIEIVVPPLRERDEDRGLLAIHFLEKARVELGKDTLEFTPGTLERIASLDFRENNVRELDRLVFHMVMEAEGDIVRFRNDLKPNTELASEQSLTELLKQYESSIIGNRLEVCGGKVSRTAESLGISRVQLWRKMNELGLRISENPQ